MLLSIGFPLPVDERPHTGDGSPFFDPRQLHHPPLTRTRGLFLTDLHRAAFPSPRPEPHYAFRERPPTPAEPG